MASSGFRSPNRRFRFRGFKKPLARKKLIWCTTSGSGVEVAGVTTRFQLLLPNQWQLNTTASDLEHAKILRLILDITAVPLVTGESRIFALSVDDSTQGSLDPSNATNYGSFEPFHIGRISVGGNTQVQGSLHESNNFLDNMRTYKVNRKVRSDMNLNLNFSPAAAAANQLTISFLARILVQLD